MKTRATLREGFQVKSKTPGAESYISASAAPALDGVMFRSRLMVRAGLRVTGIGALATVAQGKYLHSKYEPLPAARGPLRGVAAWASQQPLASAAPSPLRWWASRGQQADSDLTDSAETETLLHHATEKEPLHAKVHTAAKSWLRQQEENMASRVPVQRQKNILFVGDSLVTGVGCSQEGSSGPPLPRAVAEFLSRHLRVDVQWAAIGETGCDLGVMREKLVPAVAQEVRRLRDEGQHIDLVVVVCGLNDFKKAYQSVRATASNFRNELGEIVAEFQEQTCEEGLAPCTVVLPALPVHRAPVFHGIWPFQPMLNSLASLWDEQKRVVAQDGSVLQRVRFLRNAEGDEWWSAKQYWAVDGIHPNDAGYRIWGEHIARGILTAPLSR